MAKNEFTIKIVEDNSGKVKKELNLRIKKVLTMWGIKWQQLVTPIVPVDTGRLRASMTYKTTDKETVVGSNVEYAAMVNNGSSKRKAHKFMEKSILNQKDVYKKIAEDVLKS